MSFSICSKSCEYALQILAAIPPKDWEKRFSPAVICKATAVKESFARKGLQALSRAGILEAETGPRGGYRLSRRPDRISLIDVICAIDGEDTYKRCMLGLPACGSGDPCPFHHTWKALRGTLLKTLKRKTVNDLMKKYKKECRERGGAP